MNIKHSVILASALVCTTTLASPPSTPAAKINLVEEGLRTPVMFTGDSRWTIEERMIHYGVPGVSIAVIDDFKMVWRKSYGIKDKGSGEKVTVDTLFQAASISKPVTAMGVLKMVEEKQLQLEQPVNKQLRSWRLPENRLTRKQPVLLSHLLSHSAGLTVHGFPGYAFDKKIPRLQQILDGRSPANTDPVRVVILPGTKYRYSGGGYTVIQQLMTDVSKQPFPELMARTVLSPIGMVNSSYEQTLSPKQLKQVASGYFPDKSAVKGKYHRYPEMAAAGLWSTATDLAKFAIDLQLSIKGQGGKVLSQQMAQKMVSPSIDDFIGLGLFFHNNGEKIADYFRHSGWDEGFSSQLVAHKHHGYGVVILTNSNHPAFVSELVNSVAAAYQWQDYLMPTLTALPISATDIRRISGTFESSDELELKVFSENGKLYSQYTDAPKHELLKIGDNQYIRRSSPNRITFVDKGDGQPLFAFVNIDGSLRELSRVK